MWARIVEPRICIMRKRGFFRDCVDACVCHVGACVKLLSNILKRMLTAYFGSNLITLDYAAKF